VKLTPYSKVVASGAALLVLAQVIASSFLPRGYALTSATDLITAGLMLCALLASAHNISGCEGRCRLFWILQSVGWGLWLADQALWIVFEIGMHKEVPDLFAGDALLFFAAVPMLAALLLRPHLEPSERNIRLGALDFLLLMLWWVYLYVYFIVSWQYVAPTVHAYDFNYDTLYLIEDLAMAGVLIMLWAQSSGKWRRLYLFFILAIAVDSVSFALLNRAIENGTYYAGSWYDLPYAGAFAMFTLVALQGKGLKAAPPTFKDYKYDAWMAGIATAAVLSLPFLAAVALLDNSLPPVVTRFRVIVSLSTMVILAAMVFIKQHRMGMELRGINDVLQEASLTDPLTGVRNRRYFAATIASDAAQSLRCYADGRDEHTRDLVFYLIDADNFKLVNDTYGHDAGDRVLVEFVRRISSAIRNSDVLVRWGGEEFLVLSRYTDRGDAGTLASRVLAAVSDKPYEVGTDGTMVQQTCSIGWAAYPWLQDDPEAMSYEEVLGLADKGLSAAKRAGKNRSIGILPSGQQNTPLPSHLLKIDLNS
jgi:diguanylate cyclase (GGDEF)-like protein